MICITLRLIVKPERVDGLLRTMRRLIPEAAGPWPKKSPISQIMLHLRVPRKTTSLWFFENVFRGRPAKDSRWFNRLRD